MLVLSGLASPLSGQWISAPRAGYKRLMALLPFNRKSDVLAALGVTEDVLLAGWREWVAG